MPPSGDRVSLDALVLRLEREPEVADLYVEGPFDELLYSYLFRSQGMRAASVRPIEWLHVPSDLFPPEVDPGNRDRLLAAAAFVDERLPDVRNVRFLADSDFDVLGTDAVQVPCAECTDVSASELYLWHDDTVDRAVSLYAGVSIAAEEALAAIRPVAEELFLIRAASRETELHLGTVPVAGLLALDGNNELHFDRDEYTTRLLVRRGVVSERERLEQVVEELRASLPSGNIPAANGHDFVELLRLYVKLVTGRSPQQLDRALLAAVNIDHLLTFPRMRALVDHFRSFETV